MKESLQSFREVEEANANLLSSLPSLRVVDLRKELKKRGLSTTGRKAVLFQRLKAALDDGKVGEKKEKTKAAVPTRRSRRRRN